MRLRVFLRGFGLAWLLLLLTFVSTASVVRAAAPYGRDTYGNCTYGACVQHTTAATPSGLKVAINLTDGQVIPTSGYTIIITPLNGAGSSFKQADIYIDGVKVSTVTPGSDGTARWSWDPGEHPGTNVEVRVTDTVGTVTTFQFAVILAAPAVGASGLSGGGVPKSPHESRFFATQLLSDLKENAERTIKKLPAPVVYTFPYLLFVLLLIEIVVLLLQTKRELREVATAKKLADKEHNIASMKQTLMELVSHYLRTPLTILQGAAEGLTRDGVPPATVTSLQAIIKELHDAIESLIATTSQAGTVISAEAAAQPAKTRRRAAAGQIALWLPVLLVGLAAFGFVYLANHVSRFNTNTLGVLTQIVTYSILILVLYQVARRWHLHRHDARGAKKILEEEKTIQTLRDGVITQTADHLQQQVAGLGALIKSVPATAANAKFMNRGYEQLATVTSKFVVASHLRGARSLEPSAPVTLQSVLDRVSDAAKQAAAAKQVSLSLTHDMTFSTQNISLLSLVLQTVLDNAVAYSKEQGIVELAAALEGSHTTISVTDHGSGVPADKQTALFQPFFKAEGAEEFNREGMGFSLYLDKLIMAYLGGDISLRSEPDTGTTVTLILEPSK